MCSEVGAVTDPPPSNGCQGWMCGDCGAGGRKLDEAAAHRCPHVTPDLMQALKDSIAAAKQAGRG